MPPVCSRLSELVREVGRYGLFRSASLMPERTEVDGRKTATEGGAVISLAFYGACGEVSGVAGGTEPAERGRAHGRHRWNGRVGLESQDRSS